MLGMKEIGILCIFATFWCILEARSHGGGLHKTKFPMEPSNNQTQNKITKWDMDGGSMGRARGRKKNPYDADIADVVMLLESMTAEIRTLRSQVTNVKYQNHLIYKQLKKANRCSAPPAPVMMATEPEPPICPEEFTYNENLKSCYKFAADRITWRMAREKCLALGADLVSIENGREQRYIMEQARNSKDFRHCDFWTGLSDAEHKGVWKWKGTGRSAAWTNWNINEPNNGSGDEHCMHMLWVFNFAWNDARCNYDNSCYICEATPNTPRGFPRINN